MKITEVERTMLLATDVDGYARLLDAAGLASRRETGSAPDAGSLM